MTNKEMLKGFVFSRLVNKDAPLGYDGFDMSGYDNSFYKNMALLGRFSDILTPKDECRSTQVIIPTFWKGGGNLLMCRQGYYSDYDCCKSIKDISGWSTLDIIVEILEKNGVNLYDKKTTELADYFS